MGRWNRTFSGDYQTYDQRSGITSRDLLILVVLLLVLGVALIVKFS